MAAAYAALVSLFNNLELIQTHPRHSFSFNDEQIQSLLQIVCFLIDFMETGAYHGSNKEAAEDLERQIASATHAAEDVVESHVVDQIHAGSTLDGKKRSRFLPDVQKVIEDMDSVKRKAIEVQNTWSGFIAEQPTSSAAASSTPLTSEKAKMVGFDDVLIRLLDLLTDYPSSQRVITIVGTAGIGKTTLAKNAFQHKLIVEHFDVCHWVTISQQYVVTDILLTLLFRRGEPNTKTVGELGVELHKSLYGRRYLIVLDDMWSVEAWEKIKHFFPNTSCGSRIIVTSRQSDVADHLGSSPLPMSFLEKDESWDLFCHKAFAGKSCPPELEEAGKKIVEKCAGLPLAIVVVGGHLQKSSRTQEDWENVANHMNSILSREKDDQLFKILYLSYSNLPIHLKPCFLYMGVFREDDVIPVSSLTRLWIAEGFLKPNGDQTLEEVAEGCLNDLIARNLILVDHWSLKRKSETCVIHDVLREMCIEIAKKEKFFHVFDTSESIHGERRVVINEGDVAEMQHVLRSAPLVRSQITWERRHLLSDSKLLRVVTMKASEERIDKLENIFRRVNLRLLDGSFQMNPSISLLWNLQTLIVKGVFGKSPNSTIAPSEFWKMTQLRHLKCSFFCLRDPLPSDMVLQNLQTLGDVVNFRFSDEICKRIPNIKKLEIEYSDYIKEYGERQSYCPNNLGSLHKLESLQCSIYPGGRRWDEFAQALTFPSSLKNLSLWSPHLDWEEITTKIGSLPLLEVLDLGDVEGGAEWNPVEGGFPRLRSLHIGCRGLTYSDEERLRYWNAESSHFPVLEDLSLGDMAKLDEFPCGIGEIPTLERIDLSGCSVSLAISTLRIVVEQEQEHGNESIKLNVWFGNVENRESFNKIAEEEDLSSNNLNVKSKVS